MGSWESWLCVLSSSFRLVEPPQVVAKRTVEDCDAVSDQLHDECRSETVGTNPVAVSC